MRITNSMLISNMSYNTNMALNRMELLQYQTSTGKKFRLPSDDPIGASKSLKFNTDISKVEQYKRNAKDAKSWMVETESALKEVQKILKRADDLTVQASNGTLGEDDREKIGAEIKELKESLVQIANTNYAGRSIFTGFKTDEPLLVKNDKGKVVYNVKIKNDEVFNYNVGVAETVNVNTLGNKIFGTGKVNDIPKYDTEPGKNDKPYLMELFDGLSDALEGKDSSNELDTFITKIKDASSNTLSVTAEIGARANRLDITIDKIDSQVLNLEELLSYNEDVSLPEANMKLLMAENVYRASLMVGSKIIQPSLVDFIR